MITASNVNCRRCPLHKTRKCVVDGSGSYRSPLFVCGEAPGREENNSGTPFVGQSGRLLRSTLAGLYAGMGLDPTMVYFSNAVKCRPPNNRDPLQAELDECLPWLIDELDEVKPKCILAVGKFAQQQIALAMKALGIPEGVMKRAYHPAYILRRKNELGKWKEQLATAVRHAWNVLDEGQAKPIRYIRGDEIGEPDYGSPWLSADTETDSLEDGIGNKRIGYSVSDGVRSMFSVDNPPTFNHVYLHEASYDLPLLGIDPDDLDKYDDTLVQAYVTRRFPFVGLKKITPGLVGLDWEFTLGDHTGKKDGLLKADVEVVKILKSGKEKISTKRVDIPFSQALANDWKKSSEYAATDALATALDAQALAKLMDSMLWARKYYEEIEKPLIPVIVAMQQVGVQIDIGKLDAAEVVIDAELIRAEAELKEAFGLDINFSSGDQMAPVLLARNMIDGKKTETGKLGTAEKNIFGAFGVERWEDMPNTPEAKLVLAYSEFKKMRKLKSTYVKPLREQRDSLSRIHGRFNQAATNTNRLSSSDPNLQNFPAHTKIGLAIRGAFVAGEGYALAVGDFSQLQLRDIAEIVGDQILLDTYISPTQCDHLWVPLADRVQCTRCEWVEGDYHTSVATELGRPRSVIKNFNFAVAFGAEAEKAALTAGVALADMKLFMETLRERLPKLVNYRKVVADQLTAQGYVESIQGWHMVFPDWFSAVDKWRAAALREAVCGTIQATEAGTVKRFMVATYHMCKRYAARIVLQVHDELAVEVPYGRVDEFVVEWKQLAVEIGRVDLKRVPLRLSVKVAENWADAK